MKKGILIVIVIGALGWAIFDFVMSSDDSAEENNTVLDDSVQSPPTEGAEESDESDEFGLEEGEIAPDFELKTLDGETMRLSDYRGERVMLNFWATWCPPCRAEMPDMQKLYDEEDVVILAVNMTETENNLEEV
ncbi:peroxiredoxin family protein [Natribacillus halophilus]|uniref:AhpC/TSA family protein n=1 Tax=Natribacillus halophilus TaxID=549003 RepID=A0A1G8LNK5_9BACI|nr:AhpC/TSA family protein [Natribacillus halophilus]